MYTALFKKIEYLKQRKEIHPIYLKYNLFSFVVFFLEIDVQLRKNIKTFFVFANGTLFMSFEKKSFKCRVQRKWLSG